jgi:hypothetical protein
LTGEQSKMPSKAIVAIAALLAIAGCSSASKRPFDPGAFASVRTLEMRDATDPVLLASTSAKRVLEYLEIGLKGRGYAICHDCQSDAVATVTVTVYSTKREGTRDWIGWGNLNYLEYGQSVWTLGIVRNGETIFQKRMSHNKAMPIDQLTGQQVRDLLQQIPARQ